AAAAGVPPPADHHLGGDRVDLHGGDRRAALLRGHQRAGLGAGQGELLRPRDRPGVVPGCAARALAQPPAAVLLRDRGARARARDRAAAHPPAGGVLPAAGARHLVHLHLPGRAADHRAVPAHLRRPRPAAGRNPVGAGARRDRAGDHLRRVPGRGVPGRHRVGAPESAGRRVTPPILNDLVALQKDVGLISLAGPIDAIRAAQINVAQTFNYTPYVVAAALFVLMAIPLVAVTDWVTLRAARRQSAEGTA